MKSTVFNLAALLLALAVMLCAVGCSKPAPVEPGSQDAAKPTEQEPEVTAEPEPTAEPDGQAAKETEQAEKATEEPAATTDPAIPEPTEMTWAEYNQYCLDLLHGIQREAVHPETLERACEVYIRMFDGSVEVFEEFVPEESDMAVRGFICSLPLEAFHVPDDAERDPEVGSYYGFYYDPNSLPEEAEDSPIIYRSLLGGDWALLTVRMSGFCDEAVFLATDGDWSHSDFCMIEDSDVYYTKCGGGRCGDSIFACCRYGGLNYANIHRSDDGGKTWQRVDLPLPKLDEQAEFFPLSLVFDGSRGILPVRIEYSNPYHFGTLFFITEDGGMTWAPME